MARSEIRLYPTLFINQAVMAPYAEERSGSIRLLQCALALGLANATRVGPAIRAGAGV